MKSKLLHEDGARQSAPAGTFGRGYDPLVVQHLLRGNVVYGALYRVPVG